MSMLTLNLCLLTTSWCMDRYDLCFQDQRLSFFLTEKGCYNSFFGPLRKWKKIVILKKIPDFFRTGRLYTVTHLALLFPDLKNALQNYPNFFRFHTARILGPVHKWSVISFFCSIQSNMNKLLYFLNIFVLFACAITFCLSLYREKTCGKLVFCLDLSEKAVF